MTGSLRHGLVKLEREFESVFRNGFHQGPVPHLHAEHESHVHVAVDPILEVHEASRAGDNPSVLEFGGGKLGMVEVLDRGLLQFPFGLHRTGLADAMLLNGALEPGNNVISVLENKV